VSGSARSSRSIAAAAAIDVSFAARKPWTPAAASLRGWAVLGLHGRCNAPVAVSVRIVGARASRTLNARYRGKDAPTNVLSFAGPGMSPDGVNWLGEIVICAAVVAKEARQQRKPRQAHWAHMTIHGVLHLLGFDHIEARAARKMEAIETQILESMGFSNPYLRF
jgi:probable rRNA maturation factor